jgi:P pilus assembly chaperone PapD
MSNKRQAILQGGKRSNLQLNHPTNSYYKPMLRLFNTLLLLTFSIIYAQPLTIAISPARSELVVEPGQSATSLVTVMNDAEIERDISVEVEDWYIDDQGEIFFVPSNSLATSASSWIAPQETLFTLAAKSESEFRITVTAPSDPNLVGTYHSVVFFRVNTPPAADGQSNLGVGARVGYILYITIAGTEQVAVNMVDFFQEEQELILVTNNDGNTSVRLSGTVELRDEAGNVAYALAVPDVPLIRESQREIRIPLPEDIKSGFYVALALVDTSQGNKVVGELPLTVP